MSLNGKPPMGLKTPKPTAAERAAGRAHMARVKALPCVACGKPGPSDAHHCIHDRFSQRKASDFETIPLCKYCHQWGPNAIHNRPAKWRRINGADHEFLPVVAGMIARELSE